MSVLTRAPIDNGPNGWEGAMKRIWKEWPKVPLERTSLDVLPLDPRDPDVLRAKALAGRKES
jgi:hypothetical protein